MARKVRGEPDLGDLGAAERMPAEMIGFVQSNVDLARRAKWRHVAQQLLRDFQRAGVQGTNLPPFQRRAVRRAQLVEVAQRRDVQNVLRVPEQIDDGHNLDAAPRRRVDQPRKLPVGIGAAARDPRKAGVFDRVLQVQVQLLISPLRVTRQLPDQPVEPLDLARQIPLKASKRK